MGKAQEIKWSDSTSARVILVAGAEEFLASRFVRRHRTELLKQTPQLEISEIDASEYQPGGLYELTAPSLFGEERFVVINRVETCTDALIEDGIALLTEPVRDCVVIFRHGGGVRGKKLLDALKSNADVALVSCEKIVKEADRVAFATSEFKNAKRPATAAAVRALVDAFGEDVAGLAAACAQLVQDVPGSIDEDVVERYFTGRADVDTFKIVDAAIAGNAGLALQVLKQAFDAGAEPASLVGAFAHRVRGLAKLLNNRQATAAQLGMQPWAIDKARKELIGWTEAGMAAVVQELAVMDAASKGMDRSPQFSTERFVLLLANKGVKVG